MMGSQRQPDTMRAIVIPPLTALPEPGSQRDALAAWLASQGVREIAWAPGAATQAQDWEGFLAGCGGSGSVRGAASELAAVRHELGDEPVVVVGLDLQCAFDLQELIEDHLASPAIATVAVLPAAHGEGGNVEMDRAGRILRLTPTRRGETMAWENARAYVIEPRLFESVEAAADWGLEADLFRLVLQSQGILGGFKIRGARLLGSSDRSPAPA